MPEFKQSFPVRHQWPPLITIENTSWIVRLRDVAVTSLAWAVLFYLLRDAILLVIDWFSYPFGELSYTTPPDWPKHWRRIAPFVYMVITLITWLLFWGIRRRKYLKAKPTLVNQPSPLDIRSEATEYNLTVETLHTWRQTKRLMLDGPPEARR